MSTMKVTLIGIQTALSMKGESIFDLMLMPPGIDKETVEDNILMEGSDFEVLYPNPDFFRHFVNIWSKKHYRTFEKWIDALNMEYNPLENYDRIEDWSDITKGEKNTTGRKDSGNIRTLNNQDKRTLNTTDERTLNTQEQRILDTTDERTLNTENQRTLNTQEQRSLNTEDKETRNIEDKTTFNKTTTTEHEVSAFDASTYQPSSKDTQTETGDVTVDGTGTDTFNHTGTDTMNNTGTDTMNNTGTDTLERTGTDTMNNTGTDTLEHTGTDTVDYSGTIKDEYGEGYSSKDTDDNTLTHAGRIHGNIGVTTSQQMLQSELDIARFNIVQQITDLFMTEFLIMVYD